MARLDFQHPLILVFCVKWSFRNHSTTPICCSKILSNGAA